MSTNVTHRRDRSRPRHLRLALAAVGFVGLVGCGSPRPAAVPPTGPAGAGPAGTDATREWQNRLDALVQARGAVGNGGAAGTGSYRIGPGDQLDIQVFAAEQLSAQTRVGSSGEISLPLLGQVPASGRTPEELERHIEERLAGTYMRDPHVRVEVLEMRSSGVSVIGAVRTPGVYQVTTDATLLDVLAMAEGLDETAGGTVLIARGGRGQAAFDPEVNDTTGAEASRLSEEAALAASRSVEEVRLQDLVASGGGALNPPVHPGDIVNVRPGGVVYVMGQVNAPGGFPMTGSDHVTVLQALALAEGLGSTANASESIIIRDDGQGGKLEIPVDLDEVLEGETPPPLLAAEDVLFIPNNTVKSVAKGAWESLIRLFTFRPFIW